MKTLISMLLLLCTASLYAQQKSTPEILAQQQLDAYNKHHIDDFLAPYSDSVAIYQFPDKLLYTGKQKMREEYASMFTNTPDLFCKLQNRIVLGATVIDHELVTFDKNKPPFSAIAIYKIENNKIAKVYFIMP
jgi:hypothetical protein